MSDFVVRLHLELRTDQRPIDLRVRQRTGAIARRGEGVEKSEGSRRAERIERSYAPPVRDGVVQPILGFRLQGELANNADDGLVNPLPLSFHPPIEFIEATDGEAVEEWATI
jgi:hypothetical protein